MQDYYRQVLQGSNQQNKNFNRKRVRVVSYLEQKTNPNRNIHKQFNTNTANQTDDAKQNNKKKIIDIFAAMRLFVEKEDEGEKA